MTNGFAAFLLRRLIVAVVFVALVSASAFTLTRLAPGDATSEAFLAGASPASLAEMREQLGLDRPLLEELGRWFVGAARLDLGVSSRYPGRAVRDLVVEHATRTAELASAALILGTLIGLPCGVLIGSHPTNWFAKIGASCSVALVSCPPMVGALALLLVASMTGWLSTAPGHLALPTLALALPLAAMLERLQAQAMLDALAAPDLLAGAARGLSASRLLWTHAARQSLRPILGVYGIVIGAIFSGSFVVEIVTSWPGLGRLMYDALVGRDLFLVSGCALAGAVCLAVGNFIADIARAVADPRVREAA